MERMKELNLAQISSCNSFPLSHYGKMKCQRREIKKKVGFVEENIIHLLLNHPLKSKRLGIGVREETQTKTTKSLHYLVKRY